MQQTVSLAFGQHRGSLIEPNAIAVGEIDYNALTAALTKHKDRHAIINVNVRQLLSAPI